MFVFCTLRGRSLKQLRTSECMLPPLVPVGRWLSSQFWWRHQWHSHFLVSDVPPDFLLCSQFYIPFYIRTYIYIHLLYSKALYPMTYMYTPLIFPCLNQKNIFCLLRTTRLWWLWTVLPRLFARAAAAARWTLRPMSWPAPPRSLVNGVEGKGFSVGFQRVSSP